MHLQTERKQPKKKSSKQGSRIKVAEEQGKGMAEASATLALKFLAKRKKEEKDAKTPPHTHTHSTSDSAGGFVSGLCAPSPLPVAHWAGANIRAGRGARLARRAPGKVGPAGVPAPAAPRPRPARRSGDSPSSMGPQELDRGEGTSCQGSLRTWVRDREKFTDGNHARNTPRRVHPRGRREGGVAEKPEIPAIRGMWEEGQKVNTQAHTQKER